MKKLVFLGLGSALIFTMSGIGSAQADGGPHFSSQGVASTTYSVNAGGARCASCHRAHTAKATMLLKEAQPALCYTCHGGGWGANTDVQNGTSSSGAGLKALRGGGFENALIGASEAMKTLGPALVPDPITGVMPPSYYQLHSTTVPVGASEATTSRHEINGTTTGTMWGNGAISATANVGQTGVTLECGSCHDPHGNGNYRILKPVPNDSDKNIAVVPVNIPDVPATVARVYTTTDYWSVTDRAVPTVKGGAAPAATVTDGYIANASQWCSTCHTRYLAGSNSYKTDSGDAVFMYRHRSDRVDKAGVERPNCIQCHVSHGSNAAMSGASVGLNPGDTPVVGADSRLLRIDNRGVCVACHNV